MGKDYRREFAASIGDAPRWSASGSCQDLTMPQQAPSKAFKLPRVRWSDHGIQLLSFRRDTLHVLGEYLPGEGAVVFNPLMTGAKSPGAIASHEHTHQSLGINSSFGFFTQLLFPMAQKGFARDVLRKCLEEQWCVQELAATYAESSYIAQNNPELLPEQIRSLPSGRLNQPPYREVFEAMNHFLPVDPGKPSAVLMAQDVLVTLLALAAMNSECLLQMAAGPGTESNLLACIVDSPACRLERIMNRLLTAQQLEPLLAEMVSQISRDPRLSSTIVYKRLVTLVPEVSIQADENLFPQAAKVAAVYESITGHQLQISRASRPEAEPMVKIMESREKEKQLLAASPPRKISPASLRQLFVQTSHHKLGLSLELAILKTEESHIIARPYYLKPKQAPQPADPEEYPPKPLPGDLRGLMSARSVLRQLWTFPRLPHVVIFIDDSWRFWDQIPGARERFNSCVRICRQTHLSRDFVLHNILAFEGIGNRAEFFVFKRSPGSFAACFFNRQRPLAYAIQKVASDFGLQLFTSICTDLGLTHCAEAKRVVPHFELLNMVSWEYG
jgi:hypothetical protein